MAQFQRMHVSVFDVHLWKPPLLGRAQMAAATQELADPQGRAAFSASSGSLDLAHQRVFPLA
jgi:hypothetical protein